MCVYKLEERDPKKRLERSCPLVLPMIMPEDLALSVEINGESSAGLDDISVLL